MSKEKISIRFFDDREVRAIWDEENAKWWFSVLDIIAVLTDQDDYNKTRNYWKYLKAKLKKENSQVVSATTQLKILAPDGNVYPICLITTALLLWVKHFPEKKQIGL
jgi:cell filamentation protein